MTSWAHSPPPPTHQQSVEVKCATDDKMTDSGEVTAQAAVDSWTVVGGRGGLERGTGHLKLKLQGALPGLGWADEGQGRRLWLLCSGPELRWGHMHHTQQPAAAGVTDLSSDALLENIPLNRLSVSGKHSLAFLHSPYHL